MKACSIVCAVALLAGGCADPIEHRSGSEMQDQLQRGVTGQGTIGPESREAGDPANEHGIPQNHP